MKLPFVISHDTPQELAEAEGGGHRAAMQRRFVGGVDLNHI